MNPKNFRIAIIDDDAFVISHLSKHFGKRMPEAEIVGISNPIAPLGFNVYIVDREFGEDSCGQELVQRIKKVSPTSLVIAYSAFLDRDFLRDLVLQDCEGAFDKGSLEELEKMTALIQEFAETGRNPNGASGPRDGTIRSIFNLLREWNTRLSRNGHAGANYHGNA